LIYIKVSGIRQAWCGGIGVDSARLIGFDRYMNRIGAFVLRTDLQQLNFQPVCRIGLNRPMPLQERSEEIA